MPHSTRPSFTIMVAISSSPSATARTILSGCFFFLTLSFFSHHVAAVSFSFNFSNPSNYHLIDLRFEGDAALNQNSDLVDLTCNSKDPNENSYCKGRMSYNHPVPLYDNATGEVASFATTFTFGIHMLPNTSLKGDGMAFFLSAYPSRLLPESGSELLGLTNSSNTSATGADRFIAIEFDTYANPWDPTRASDHIGIDLSSITSVSTTRLPTDSLNTTMTATITFDNTTRMLEATLHFDDARQSQAAGRVKTQLPDNLDALLPPEVAVGFSAATGGYKELHQIHSWSFNSTMASREKPTGPNRLQPKQGQIVGMEGRQSRALVTGGAVVGALVLAVVICSTLSWCTWTRRRDSFGKGSRLKHIEYGDLTIATKGFSKDNKIGEGAFGEVHSGKLGKKPVAVKRIKDTTGEFKDFLAEMSAIDGTSNGNVVRLEGWCCHINNFMFWWLHRKNIKLFIVYELVPNGNLHQHLHENPEVLPWATRYNIVMGIGSALRHLHHECKPYILHRDIKPSNILLDNEFNAKLGDFGLSRVAHNSIDSVHTVAIGSKAYMDPLCMKDGKVKFCTSSDVYSFGIVLLEIAHGENKPVEVWKLHKYEPKTFVTDVADKKLAGIFETTEMERVIVLGLRCSDPEENQRPSLNGAMEYLVKGGELLPATREERHDLDPAFPSAAPAELGHSQQPRS